MDTRADLVTLMQRLPGVFLHLLHAEADATCSRIDAQHFNFDQVTRIYNLARVLHSLGPAHLRNVNKSLNSRLEFYKRAVVSDACNTSRHAGTDRKTFLNTGPRIRQQLLVTKRNALAIAIKLQNFHLDRVAHLEQLVRVLEPSPRHVSHVQQSIDAAKIHECTVVSKIFDLSFDYDVFLDLLERLIFPAGVLLLDNSLARQYNIGPLAVQLDHFGFDHLIAQAIEVAHRTNINLRTRKESSDTIDVNAQSAFDAIHHATLHARAVAISLFEIIPGLHAHGIGARKDRKAIGCFHALDEHFNFVAGFDCKHAVLGELGRVNNAFRLVAEIDNHSSFAQANDGAANDFALFERRLFLFELVEKLSEIHVAAGA